LINTDNDQTDNEESSVDKAENEDNQDNRRKGLMELLDDFIDQVLFIRRTLFTVSLSAILLAPVSIALCIYLFVHPSFFKVLDATDDFGEILTVLLVSVIGASAIWLAVGIKQYNSINSWNKKYVEYQQAQRQMEKKLEEEFGLFPDNTSSG
jgi:hypothetical protein